MRNEIISWSHTSGESIWEPYLNLFKDAPVSDEEFSYIVNNSSKNFLRHVKSHFNPVRECLNSIHSKNKFIPRDLSSLNNEFLSDKKINFKTFLARIENSPISEETLNKLIKSKNLIASYDPSNKETQLIIFIANQLHNQEPYISIDNSISVSDLLTGEIIDYDLEKQILKLKNDSAAVRQEKLRNSPKTADKIKITTIGFKRNPYVIIEALLRADGFCERCNKQAPFIRKKDNTPYLEVHHKIMLSDGGEDTVENTIALCPNCHRELHFGLYNY